MNSIVAICAPTGRDQTLILRILEMAGLDGEPMAPAGLKERIENTTIAAAILTEEAVAMLKAEQWRETLAEQPPWSDFPFVVLTSLENSRPQMRSLIAELGNVVQVSRPLHPAALVDLVRNALRARARQLEAKRYLELSQVAESNLQNFADDLERQVEERTHALTETNRRLALKMQESSEAQLQIGKMQAELIHVSRVSAMDTMASALAHELNQPLTSVVNYLQGSIRLIGGSADTDSLVRDGLEQALASAKRAGDIIRRLRDLVSRGVVNRQPEDVAQLIDEAVALGLIEAKLHGVSHRISIDGQPAPVVVDRVQIQQVIINLLRNALEAMSFMAQEKTREITISAAQKTPETVAISIADSGPGMDEEVLRSLFSSFRTTKEEGMGLGLSICQTIIEANGGNITGENRPVGGAVFRFTLPTARSPSLVSVDAG